MADRENIYRIETGDSQEPAVREYPNTDEEYCRVDMVDTERISDPLDRRESALNARIAQFETIVRKTKLDMAQRRDLLQQDAYRLEDWEKELARREEAVRLKEAELNRREEAFEKRITDFSVHETDYLERTEALVKSEMEFQRDRENFNSRSAAVLQKIRTQKTELEKLLSHSR